MSIEWYDLVGTVGVILILIVYYLLQVERINPQGLLYSVANLVGAGLIAVSLVYQFNFSALLIEICWMLISALGISRYLRQRRDNKSPESVK
jgi:drug/metabolite transporter (DMT)-like permease